MHGDKRSSYDVLVTQRKPPGASWQSWIERQIDEGREDGAFDDLEGHGRPIVDLDRPHDDLWWVKAKLRDEDVTVTPPAIAIRLDRDAVLDAAMHASTADEIRSAVESLNERIREVNRRGTWGPPTNVAPLDAERIVERWRDRGVPPSDANEPLESALRMHEPRRVGWLRAWLRRRRGQT